MGNTLSAVRNSYKFSEFVTTQVLDEAECLISFDVISLFTRIPVNLAISVAKFCLENDNTLQDHTCLSVSSIVSLLRLCLKATYFSFRGEIYQQGFGTAMGAPVSVIVANLVMENVEERALNSYPNPPKFWKRYVDDVCVAMKKDKTDDFLSHLNSIELMIQFTVETEDDDNTLPFLDTRLHRMEDGIIQTSVCRKPTHTDRYLDYMSHHPIEHKKAVVQTLCTRAGRLSSTPNNKSSEVKHIFNALKKNGYPKQLIQWHFKVLQSKADVPAEDKDDTITVVLSYVKGVSEAKRRILARANIQTTFRPCYTLKQHLMKPKDPVSLEKKSNVVYSVPCKSCSAVYACGTLN